MHKGELFTLPSQWSAGLDISYNEQERASSTESQTATVSTVNPYNFSVGEYGDFAAATGPIPSRRNQLRTVALYMENRTTLLPDLNLVTGLRYENIELESINLRTPGAISASNPLGEPATFTRSYEPVTWRAGLMYDITPTFNVYAQYSTAADPPAGILTTTGLGPILNYDLTTGRQYEVGSKFDFWEHKGSATLAGFYIERENLTTRDPNLPGGPSIPIGKQSSWGMEANMGLKLTEQWSFQGNMAWVDARFDDFNDVVSGVPVSRTGNRPQNVAEWVANAWLTWDLMQDWQWNFGMRYVGDRWADTANTIPVPAYELFDTQLSWQVHPNAKLTARCKNLTDEAPVIWGTGTPMFIIGAPRTFEMALKLDF